MLRKKLFYLLQQFVFLFFCFFFCHVATNEAIAINRWRLNKCKRTRKKLSRFFFFLGLPGAVAATTKEEIHIDQHKIAVVSQHRQEEDWARACLVE